mmetsp:Transcript_137265/g.342200  ORF Transcript_137265/g.342200 Transcript_137265/m.342200 type:complete len:1031 (+) Transcript_137265:85-3177(+)
MPQIADMDRESPNHRQSEQQAAAGGQRRPQALLRRDAAPASPLSLPLPRMDSGISTRSSSMPLARRRCISCIAIIAHVMSGLSIVIVNKMIVHDHGLHTPALVSSTGALFTAAFTRLLVFLGRVHVRPVSKRPWEFAFRRALPVGVCAAGSLCFGNMSYIYLDAGFVQMLKAGTPALLLFVLAVLRVEVVSGSTACLALLMVFGSTLATLQQPHATAFGLAIQMTSQLCEVLQCTAMQVFLQQLGFEAWDAGYYLAPAIATCCLIPALVFEWPNVIATHKVGVLYRQVPLLVMSGSIGIVVNIASFYVIKFTSSLLAKLLVIARSSALVIVFILNGESFTWLQVVGYVITLGAFACYSVVKAREMEQQALADARAEESAREAEPRESDEDLLEAASPTASMREAASFDLTSSMFWFAVCVVVAGGYQAAVVGDIPSRYGMFERELTAARHKSVSSVGLPPTPYLEPITAGTQIRAWSELAEAASGEGLETRGQEHGSRLHTAGALSVESAAKVLYLTDGRFMLHTDRGPVLHHRTPENVLSSSWLISSKQFGTVYLSGLNNKGDVTWLSCGLDLVQDWGQACLLWMTASRWDRWTTEPSVGEYVFRRHGSEGQDLFLATDENKVVWSRTASPFHVADWVPEACPLQGMTSVAHSYPDAKEEVTFTMTTFFHVYARSIMFRQALASVFSHLKERDYYVREFLVINDWYAGRSLDFNGTFTGPDVHETRQEMLTFFPGCMGASTEVARRRPVGQKCTFVFKGEGERGQQKALNILLDLMVTKFWIQFEDDHVFYQDVFVSRLLAPMYDHPNSCWHVHHQASSDRTPAAATAAHDWGTIATSGLSGEDAAARVTTQRRRLDDGGAGSPNDCLVIAGVRLGGKRGSDGLGSEDWFDVESFQVPDVLFNKSYVRELLAHGGFDDDASHGWGDFKAVGAVPWPLFSLRPSLHNLTYIKSLEAPLFYEGRPGRFSEDLNITRWRDGGKTYNFHWDFELEFAVRWARGGATFATLSPGACMRDVSNGISSFERSFEYG